MRKEFPSLGALVGLFALVGCAPEQALTAVITQTPSPQQTETPIPPTVFLPTILPSLSPTTTETPMPTLTPWPTLTPYPSFWLDHQRFPSLSRTEMQQPEIVPYVEPGDVLTQVAGSSSGAIIKKDGHVIMISQYVLDEYRRAHTTHPQILTPDNRLYFEAHNYTRDERKRSEVRRWSANKPFEGSYIPAATCDTGPNCSFRHPPAIDSLGLYGVVIQDETFLRLFEVNPHHEGILWKAPPNWMIKEAAWGIGVEEDDLYLVMEHFHDYNNPYFIIDKVAIFRLRDAAEHQHFPSEIVRDCDGKCTNTATHRMMEYNQMKLTTRDWPLRLPGKQPKLELLVEGDPQGIYLYNLKPVWSKSSGDGREDIIYPVKEP